MHKDFIWGSAAFRWSCWETPQPVVAHQTEKFAWLCKNCFRLNLQACTSWSEDIFWRWNFSNTFWYWALNVLFADSCTSGCISLDKYLGWKAPPSGILHLYWNWKPLIYIGSLINMFPTISNVQSGEAAGLQEYIDNSDNNLRMGLRSVHFTMGW